MNFNKKRTPFIELPNDVKFSLEEQEVIFLIREELKTTKLFNIMSMAGLEDSFYRAELDQLIRIKLGLDDGLEETSDKICDTMSIYSENIDDNRSSTEQAIKAYYDLVAYKEEKRRLHTFEGE